MFSVKVKQQDIDQDMFMLVSSYGGSGSSLLADLMNIITPKTASVFEPLAVHNKSMSTRLQDPLGIVSDIYNCNFREDFFEMRYTYPKIFQNLNKLCGGKCDNLNQINQICMASDTLLVKVSEFTLPIREPRSKSRL